MLSYFADGDHVPPIGNQVNVAAKDNWTYFERRAVVSPCPNGSVSVSGGNTPPYTCMSCPASTFSSVSNTQCIKCPMGYTSNVSTDTIEGCTREATAFNETLVFQEGELWVGNYFCTGNSNQGNGKLELLITDVSSDGTITAIRKNVNSYVSNSYYMTTTMTPPPISRTIGESGSNFTFYAGEWIVNPNNFTISEGSIFVRVTQSNLTGSLSVINGTVVFAGAMCDGFFSLTRSCELSQVMLHAAHRFSCEMSKCCNVATHD